MVLAEAVRSSTPAAQAPSNASLRTLTVGQTLLGRYEIRQFIARGGMGEVYEAFDSVLGESVALKTLLLTALDDQRAIERLADEVRLARKVTHRNVCRILEFGVYQPNPGAVGIPFLTMEFLTGESLARRIAGRGRLPPAMVADLVKDVAAGLAAIHAAGIVHRDFKSENVFLVPETDGRERAVIMDFGLARGLGDDRRRSSSTAAAGTPDYMAPEQVEGKPPTPGFDIYALGVVIFELLTGRKPFAGASPYMAALSRLRERAPAPSAFVPGLSPSWDGIVGRCLERRPERRYQRVEQVAAALQAVSGGGRVPRRMRVAAAVATLGVALAGAIALVPRQSPPPSAPAALLPLSVPPAPASPTLTMTTPAAASLPAPPVRKVPRQKRRPPAAAAPAPEATLQDAEALMLAGEVERACQLGHEAAAAMPALPAAHRFLGKCHIRRGDSPTARRHYRRYLELAPNAPDAAFIRGILEGAR